VLHYAIAPLLVVLAVGTLLPIEYQNLWSFVFCELRIYHLLHVFGTSDVDLSTYVEPLIIYVLSMKFWALCTCGCLWGDAPKISHKSRRFSEF
jgi:hypothetical protein